MKYLLPSVLLITALCFGQHERLSQITIDTIALGSGNCDYVEKIKRTIDNDPSLVGKTKHMLMKSYCFLLKRQNDSALFYADRTIEIYKNFEIGSPHADGLIHKAYYIKGLRQYFNDDPLGAIVTLNESLRLTKEFPNSPDMVSWRDHIYTRIAIIHQELGDYNLALEAEWEALKDSTRMIQKYEGGGTYLNIANLHRYLRNIDSAKIYTRRSLKLVEDSSLTTEKHYNYVSLLKLSMIDYKDLGDYALMENKKDSAISFFEKAYQIYQLSGIKENIKKTLVPLNIKTGYANVLIENNRIEESISMLTNVIDSLNLDKKYDRDEREIYAASSELLAQSYSKLGSHEAAMESQKRLSDYLIQYNESKISKQLQFYTTMYKVKEKDASIKDLSQIRDEQQLIIKQRDIIIGSVLIGLLLLVLGGYFYIKRRQLRQKYKLANLEQRLLRSQLNPHFLFNALNHVMYLSTSKPNRVQTYILKLSALLRRILENSREEFISLEEELEAVNNYLELESNLSEKFSFLISVDKEIDKDEVLVPPMFIQPFVENSIQHGLSGNANDKIEINVTLNKDTKQVNYKIVDNGIGYSNALTLKTSQKKSLSGKILKERLDIYSKAFKIKSYFKMTDRETSGTEINVFLPYLLDL